MSTATLSVVEVREALAGLTGTWVKAIKADRKLSDRTSDLFKAGLELVGPREDKKNYGLSGYFKALYSGDEKLIPEEIQIILNADKKDPDSEAGIVKNRWSVMLCNIQSPKQPGVKSDELNTVMSGLERLLLGDRRAEVVARLEGIEDAVGLSFTMVEGWEAPEDK